MSQKQLKEKTNKKQSARWTPFLIGLGGALLLLLAFFSLRDRPVTSAEIETGGSPSLKVNQEMVDLGDMKFNQVAEVSFELTNVGDATLRFTEKPYIEVVEGC